MPFLLRVRVQSSDIDELGHANNTVYLRWAQDAAVAHSNSLGLGMAEYVKRGGVFFVRRHVVDYLRPALLDDELDLETRVTAMTVVTAERQTAIRRVADGSLLARAVTTWAYVDFATGRPARIPSDLRRVFPIEPLDDPYPRRKTG